MVDWTTLLYAIPILIVLSLALGLWDRGRERWRASQAEALAEWEELQRAGKAPPQGKFISWLDRQLANASDPGVILLLIIGNYVSAMLGLIGVIFCRNPKARERAWVLLIGGLLLIILSVFLLVIWAQEGFPLP